jgi:hypothetical protein
VAAPDPDPSAAPVWPSEVDDHLKNLADVVAALGKDLRRIDQRRRDLPDPPKPDRQETPEQAEARKLLQLDQRVQGELARQRDQVHQLYRAGRPLRRRRGRRHHRRRGRHRPARLSRTGARHTVRRRPPDRDGMPVNGLSGIDRDIAAAHQTAQKGPEPAQQDGASHLFVARDQLDPDRLYGVRVLPGEDPREVHDHSDDWLLECYVLNDDLVPVHVQLAESRAWHMGPQDAAAESGEPSTPELAALEAVVTEYRQVRALTFSPANYPARYDEFEAARGRLIEAARAAYAEGVLTPFQIRRTTGYSRAQVAVGRPSGSQPVVSRAQRSR